MNRRIYICIVPFLLSPFLLWQEMDTDVLLNLNTKKKLVIYDNSQKNKKIKEVAHDFENEDYLIITILNGNDSMYQVSVSYAIEGLITKGWIGKNSDLVVFSKAYNRNLQLYAAPEKKSNYNLMGYTADPLKVIDFKAGWLKVEVQDKDTLRTGWIPPESQCANPYSTCN